MAITVINDPYRSGGNTAGVGEFASGFSNSLSQGLQGLAQHKLQTKLDLLKKDEIRKSLKTIGYSDEESNIVAEAPDEFRPTIFQGINQQRAQRMQQQQESPLSGLLGGATAPVSQSPQAPQQVMQPSPIGLSSQQPPQPQQIQQQQVAQQIQQPTQQPQQKSIADYIATQQAVKSTLGDKELKQQNAVDKANAPYIKAVDKNADNAQQIIDIANEMKQLLAKGQVQSGIWGAYAPTQLTNAATQEYITLSNKLAGLEALKYGQGSNAKIKFAQASKPNIAQEVSTQNFLLDKILETAQPAIREKELTTQLIEANGNLQPRDLRTKVDEALRNEKKAKHKENKKLEIGSTLDELPQDAPEGTILETENGQRIQRVGNQWRAL